MLLKVSLSRQECQSTLVLAVAPRCFIVLATASVASGVASSLGVIGGGQWSCNSCSACVSFAQPTSFYQPKPAPQPCGAVPRRSSRQTSRCTRYVLGQKQSGGRKVPTKRAFKEHAPSFRSLPCRRLVEFLYASVPTGSLPLSAGSTFKGSRAPTLVEHLRSDCRGLLLKQTFG